MYTCRAGRQLTLSLEMFERDVQGVMDEYLAGSITERDLRQVGCLSSYVRCPSSFWCLPLPAQL